MTSGGSIDRPVDQAWSGASISVFIVRASPSR
jgi:hypothetical protein